MAEVRSPLSSSSNVGILRTYPTAVLIEDWRAAFGIDISAELGGIEELRLYRCAESQLDFFLPSSVAGSDNLYRQLQRFEWYYMKEKWEFDEAVKDLQGSRTILEIGSGPGHFVERVLRDIPKASILGSEVNMAAFEASSRKDLPLETIDPEGIHARGRQFDAVCLFQVLEHASPPCELLNSAVGLLSSGGKLIISVPNKDSFLRYQYNLLDMPPHHMTRWNAVTLRFLETLFPLKLKRLSFEPLASYHTEAYVAAYADHWSRKAPVLSPLFGQKAINIYIKAFKRGLRRYFRGQTLYALFEKA